MTTVPVLTAIDAAVEALRARSHAHWLLAFSGGKDSTAALKIILAAYRKSGLAGLNLMVIYCDTGVENPVLDIYLKSTFHALEAEFARRGDGFATKILRGSRARPLLRPDCRA